jgi:TRAP-type mannitol/chloroaromatic compound transport system permease small subunit
MTDNIQDFDLKDELIAERKIGHFDKPDDMSSAIYKTIINIDKFSLFIGKIVCWITVPLFLCMTYEVIARKFFLAPTYWAYDMSRFFYGAMFMLGAGYALSRGVHIRADFLYRNFKVKIQGMVDFWLYLFFYFPGLSFFLYMTTGFVIESIQRGEKGMDTAWMPYMWPIKSCLWFGIVFLIIQGVSELLKSHYAMTKGKWPGE